MVRNKRKRRKKERKVEVGDFKKRFLGVMMDDGGDFKIKLCVHLPFKH